MREWRRVRVEEIAEKIAIGPFGSRMKSDLYTETGVPVIRGTNLTGGRMAKRVVVMPASSGRIKCDTRIERAHPRHYTMKTSPGFSRYQAQLPRKSARRR